MCLAHPGIQFFDTVVASLRLDNDIPLPTVMPLSFSDVSFVNDDGEETK